MHVQVKSYAKWVLQKLEPLLIEPSPIATPYRLCVSLENNIISLIHVKITAEKSEIIFNEQVEFGNNNNLTSTLTQIVKNFKVNKLPTYWLLSPEEYQLFVIDALPVKDEEFEDALNWRLRGLINYPIQEAATDYFMLPAKKNNPNQPMVVAVVTKKQHLANIINVFTQAGLEMACITIPELAMKNLATAYENDGKTTAFMYFYRNMAILNLTRQKSLFFSRRIPLPPNYHELPKFYENLSLEFLRYFDYFQSQWRHPSPARFYVGSNTDNAIDIINGLKKHLMIPLESFPLKNIILNTTPETALNNITLLTLGAALHKEEPHATPEH